jgi:GT2 family glycosyltransferase
MDIENLIVIVTYNSQDFIEDCIKSIAASDIKKCFLAVIDNNSSDKTLEKMASVERLLESMRENPSEEFNYKFIRLKKNIGFSAAVNYCVFKFFLKEYPEAAENTRFLILINPDVCVEKNTLSNLTATFDKAQGSAGMAGAAGVAGSLIYDYKGEKIKHAGGLIQDNFITSHIEKIPAGNSGLVEADYATGAVFATKLKYFINFKGFDTGYRPVYFEEVDFCLKLQKLKFKVFINTSSVARHYEGASIGKFSADFYSYYHKNRVRCALISLSFAGFLKKFIPAEIRWLRKKVTPDQYKAVFFAYFLNFLFLIYNLAVKIKNGFLIKDLIKNRSI